MSGERFGVGDALDLLEWKRAIFDACVDVDTRVVLDPCVDVDASIDVSIDGPR